MAKETMAARETAAPSLVARRALNLLRVSSNKYKDANRITVMQTPSNNWRLYYDDKDTGVTVGRKELNEYDLYDEGMIKKRR